MIIKTLDAVYEQGLFRLTDAKPLGLTDGQKVRLVVESIDGVETILDLAVSVYAGLREEDIGEMSHHQDTRKTRELPGVLVPWW